MIPIKNTFSDEYSAKKWKRVCDMSQIILSYPFLEDLQATEDFISSSPGSNYDTGNDEQRSGHIRKRNFLAEDN